MSKLVVNTKYGKLQGKLQKSIEGIEFCSFKGIPYAKPPVGELRFKVSLSLLITNHIFKFF